MFERESNERFSNSSAIFEIIFGKKSEYLNLTNVFEEFR
jgi:hypothetical protein